MLSFSGDGVPHALVIFEQVVAEPAKLRKPYALRWMGVILRWKPSVMALFLVKHHMQAICVLHEQKILAGVRRAAKPLWRSCSMGERSCSAKGRARGKERRPRIPSCSSS